MKIGINGFGRIGRQIFRIAHARGLEIVLVNDLTDNATLAHLLKYDSVHGRFDGEVGPARARSSSTASKIVATAIRDPAKLPWGEQGVDIVVESTGIFTKREACAKHLKAGAKKVLISAPVARRRRRHRDGRQRGELRPGQGRHHLERQLHDELPGPDREGARRELRHRAGLMTTIHGYTNDQRILDVPAQGPAAGARRGGQHHPDHDRRRQGGGQGAARTSTASFDGCAHARARPRPARSPTSTALMKRDGDQGEVNAAFKAAAEGPLKGIVRYTEDPIVSTDIIGDPHSVDLRRQPDEDRWARTAQVHLLVRQRVGLPRRMVDLLELMAERR